MENIRIMKTASVVDTILKVMQGFLIAGMIVCVIFIPLMAIFGEKLIASANTLDLGNIELELAGGKAGFINEAGFKPCMIGMLITVAIVLAAGWYFVRVLRQILVPMKEGRPFESGVSAKLRKLGWTALICGFIAQACSCIASILELKVYDLGAIFSSEAIKSFRFNYSIGLEFVIVALVIFFLSFVFQSGEALQKESDETL